MFFCVPCVFSAGGDWEKGSDTLQLELESAVKLLSWVPDTAGALVLWKSRKCSQLLSHLSSPIMPFFSVYTFISFYKFSTPVKPAC